MSQIFDGIGILTSMCGVKNQMFPSKKRETRSNLMTVRFTSNNMIAARGFNLTYVAIESKSRV